MYVVSHHTVNYGQIALPAFIEVCHAKNAPFIARSHEVELGYFYLDPCNLKADQTQVVADALRSLSL